MKKVRALKINRKTNTMKRVKIVLYIMMAMGLMTFSLFNDMLFFKELSISLGVVSLILFVHLQNYRNQSAKVVQLYNKELDSLERKIN